LEIVLVYADPLQSPVEVTVVQLVELLDEIGHVFGRDFVYEEVMTVTTVVAVSVGHDEVL
jgi:hypothetical protein